MGHFLICKIKSVCYDSTFYLADLYGRTLADMGNTVEFFNTDKEPVTALERYEGRHFDAILDFNSLLPNLDTDEGDLFLNRIDAPFYNYILDHPLYHHKQLRAPLDRYHVICLDDDHADYIRRYYPHIRSVSPLPLCGLPILEDSKDYKISNLFINTKIEHVPQKVTSRLDIPKAHDIVFTGTYSDANDLYQKIKSFDRPFSDEMLMLADILISNPDLTQEEALLLLAKRTGFDEKQIHVPERLYTFFLVDMYIKAYFRERVLEAVLKTGRTLTVYGGMWELWQTKHKDRLDIHDLVPFKDSPKVLSAGRISVNVMPWFKSGIHDRVLTAMRSGTLSFTDNSKMLARTFCDGTQLLTYDLNRLDEIPNLLEKYLSDAGRLEAVSEAGRLAVENGHTELVRCRALAELFAG